MTSPIGAEHFTAGRIHDRRDTNLGAGFQVDIGGATTLTIHRWGSGDKLARITWINTYGNVTKNRSYHLDEAGEAAADEVLRAIEEART